MGNIRYSIIKDLIQNEFLLTMIIIPSQPKEVETLFRFINVWALALDHFKINNLLVPKRLKHILD